MKDDKFPFPVNEFIEEEVPVKKNTFDPKTGHISSTYQTEKVKTMYINAPKEKVRCKDNDHYWKSYNPRKWLINCKNCNIVKRIYPPAYLKDGKIVRLQRV